jgi:hypothetical protein
MRLFIILTLVLIIFCILFYYRYNKKKSASLFTKKRTAKAYGSTEFAGSITYRIATVDFIRPRLLERLKSLPKLPESLYYPVSEIIIDYAIAGNTKLFLYKLDLLNANFLLNETSRAYNKNIFCKIAKCTQAHMDRLSKLNLGIYEGEWRISKASTCPHEKFNNIKFNLNIGVMDKISNKFIFPSEELDCYCYTRPIINI